MFFKRIIEKNPSEGKNGEKTPRDGIGAGDQLCRGTSADVASARQNETPPARFRTGGAAKIFYG